jgi:hypothetical protein
MALADSVFETKLKSVFASMLDGSKTDGWMASRIAEEIKSYILTGQVSTTDVGTAPAGDICRGGRRVDVHQQQQSGRRFENHF